MMPAFITSGRTATATLSPAGRTAALMLGATLLAAAPHSTPAVAQIYIGPGGPVYSPGLPPPPFGRPGFAPPGYRPQPGYGPISCEDGADVVAERGFRRIAPRDCSGRVYRYTAYRGPSAFEVRVSSATGQVTQVRRIR
jgi:hypothetical protein